jgi:DNA-binding transcriptional LysR family regulator
VPGRTIPRLRALTAVADEGSCAAAARRLGLGNSMPGMAIVAAVCQAHPSQAVTLQSGSHSAILAAVQRREVDVGVLPDVPRNPRFRCQPVLHQQAGRRHPRRGVRGGGGRGRDRLDVAQWYGLDRSRAPAVGARIVQRGR